MTTGQDVSPDDPLAGLPPPTSGAGGWYRDPAPGAGAFARRYFDGERWTDQVSGTASPVAPAAAPAPRSWSPLPPPAPGAAALGARRRSRTPAVVAGVVVVVAAIVVGLVITGVLGTGSDHPSAWDERVQPVADEVARLRGLDFEHPVKVSFLNDAEFREHFEVPSDEPSRKVADRAIQELRAVGLVTGDVDLAQAVEDEQQSGALAFYSIADEEVFVRGEDLGPAAQVTLAHELTHVLQDQHFDLEATAARIADDPNGSLDAFRGLYEGDANRIEAEYEAGLSAADRSAVDAGREQDRARVEEETMTVPFVVELLFGAPYIFGPSVVEVIAADGGNRAVDRAFDEPAFTQMIFVDPASALERPVERRVADPKPAKGERKVGAAESFGALDAYITLGARIDPVTAFDAARGWAGGRMTTVRRDGTTCVRAAMRGVDAEATRRLGAAFTTWAAARPGGHPEVGVTDDRVDVVACDPGAEGGGPSPDPALETATGLLAFHAAMESGLIAADAPVSLARCTASEALRVPEIRDLLAHADESTSAEMVDDVLGRSVAAAAATCRDQIETLD